MLSATQYKEPKIERVSLRDWLKGTVTEYDDGRTPIDGLRAAGNLVITQDGTLRPRPSLMRYGSASVGTILGEVFEFTESTATGKVTWEISMQNVSGTTRPYIRKDGGDWKVTTGKTYDNSAKAHFCQIDEKVLIMNGTDTLSYLNISTAGDATPTVVGFTALSTPSAPSLSKTGLTGTDFNIYYRISANSTVGETEASVNETITVGKQREAWDKDSDGVTVTWTAVTSAKSYNVYMGQVDGEEFLIAAGVEGTSYFDDGTAAKVPNKLAPVSNSTSGPAVTRGTVVNGQVFLTGDKDNPYLLWFGGTLKNTRLDFSPFGGGGSTEIGAGTKEFPVRVMPFRDGQGRSRVTVLCSGTNGRGKRYILSPSNLTFGDTVIDFLEVTEDNGQDGTDSPDGVILYDDSLWYPSLDGFKTTGTKPQLQNILSTDRVSETIQADVRRLNQENMKNCVGLGFQGKLYWLVPVGTTNNNQIWVLDLDQKGAWMKPWNVEADWMWLYRDNDGVTHHCILQNNEVYEFTYSQFTTDSSGAVSTNATSGVIKFSEDGQEWAKIIDVTFVLSRPRGAIQLSVTGKTEDNPLTTLASQNYISDSASSLFSGWAEASWSDMDGWADSEVVPLEFSDAQEPAILEVDEEVMWWKWELNTRNAGVDYQLTDVVARIVRIGTKDLT